MGKLVMVAAVVVFVAIPLLAVLLRRRPLAGATPVDHNHIAMARWIERQLGDDMVRVTIPPDQRDLAELLLVEFYGDTDHRRRELP